MKSLVVGLLILAVAAGLIALRYSQIAASERARADTAERQVKVDAKTALAADRAMSDRVIIIEKGAKEVKNVEKLPGATAPIEAVRRAGVCASLASVFDDPTVCAPANAYDQPAGGVSDASQ